MPRKKTRSIPVKLQEIKAYELSQQRLSKGEEPNSELDWQEAGEHLAKHPKEISAWQRREFRRLTRYFLIRCWKILILPFTSPFSLFYYLRSLFTQADSRSYALDIVKTIITALGLLATFIAGIGLFVNYWSSEKNIQLTQERLVTERFSKAIEQLGSGKDEVILGGIYSLERIARDSPKDQSTIMEVLCSFIRKNSPNRDPRTINPITNELDKTTKEPRKESSKNSPVSITTQAALTVIGRRNQLDRSIDRDSINLTKTNLNGADLSGAFLRGVNLRGAESIGNIKIACYWDKAKFDSATLRKLEEDKTPTVDRDKGEYCAKWNQSKREK